MPFDHVLGQEGAVATLERALTSGRAHHAYRFEGPDGVGKELAAFAFAQALVCTSEDPLGCGTCDACRRAVTLSTEKPASPLHPDVAIVARGFYPQDVVGKAEAKEISVEQIRKIVLAHASFPPHEGRARVFIFRRAEELSASAANALLKTLEEPRRGTHFVLLTSRGDRLLDTIRSRTLPIRFAPLSDAIVDGILAKHGVPEARRKTAVELAGGSASLALELADEEESRERDAFVEAVMGCVSARDLAQAVVLAEAGDKDKDLLRKNLRALGASLVREARASASDGSKRPLVAAKRFSAVQKALENLDKNAAPPLTMIAMIAEMREA